MSIPSSRKGREEPVSPADNVPDRSERRVGRGAQDLPVKQSPRAALIKLALLLFWPLAFTLVAEVALRLLTDHPIHADSHQVDDPRLGKRMDPDFRGIDDRGFRNPSALESAEIVAIGDSHTYGFNAGDDASWPARLAALSGRSVYNFGMGGYGPIQYSILFDEALKLKPRDILIGLYPANDLNDLVVGLKRPYGARWAAQFEGAGPGKISAPDSEEEEAEWPERLKDRSAILSVLRSVRPRNPENSGEMFIIEDENARTQFGFQRLDAHKGFVNLDKGPTREAFRLLREILATMKRKADGSGVRLLVVIIPSKEHVYFPYLKKRGFVLPADFHLVERREAELAAALETFLEETGIPFVDLYPALVEALEDRGDLYPTDGHPAEAGYAVYAETIWSRLQSSERAPLGGMDKAKPSPAPH